MCYKCRGITPEDWWARKYLTGTEQWIVRDSLQNPEGYSLEDANALIAKWDALSPDQAKALVDEINARDKYGTPNRN